MSTAVFELIRQLQRENLEDLVLLHRSVLGGDHRAAVERLIERHRATSAELDELESTTTALQGGWQQLSELRNTGADLETELAVTKGQLEGAELRLAQIRAAWRGGEYEDVERLIGGI